MHELKTLGIANNDLSDLDPHLGNMVNLVRISIEGNPLRSIKPAMRDAGAAQLKKYLQSRLSDNEVQEGDKEFASKNNLPGASSDYDHWDVLLREFI